MRIQSGVFLLLLIAPFFSFAQSRQSGLADINRAAMLDEQAAEVRILNYLKNNPEERITYFKNGGVHMLVDVTESGIPVYRQTFNATEAITLNVPALRTGGGLGVNILGTGIKLGTWDGGRVLATHVELVGRVTQNDSPSAVSDHATHTTGTMMASGVNASAKGMAPEATLIAYDFNNDVSEMSQQARTDQTSLLLSNHSYGTVSGWDVSVNPPVWRGDASISATIDYKFGFYDTRAAQFDNISYNAPYYTIVKAAGNDRGDSGPGTQQRDGGALGYDCIPTDSGAKNIITVGAVNNVSNYTGPASVVMSSFSGWGPVDDGRIKPDIVSPGVNVFSSFGQSSTDYSTISGTSMATPAVTGSLALLQQLYKNLNSGNYMRSATVKALVIHSAKEAGANPGPDYSFGWGLLDAGAAAKLIVNEDNQNIFINEATLTSGQTYEINLGTPKTATKITATLVWTDPAGTPTTPQLNPTTKMLVNDLDLKLVDDGNTTTFPWMLSLANPAAAATQGDNITDNVEKIELTSTQARNYRLRVSNKGTLNGGTQQFSLIIEYSSANDPRTSYYWVGNSGSWTDGSHWSLTSGGAAANVVPGANDRVVFNEQSFTAAGSVITMPSNQSCYSLRWFGDQYGVDLSMNSNTLTIGENVAMVTTKVTTSTAGTFNFVSSSTVPNTVDLSSNNLDKLSLNFNSNSSWTVTGFASLDKVTLTQGALTFSGSALKINQLSGSGGSTKSLSFVSSSLQGLSGFNVDFTGMTLSSDNTSSLIASPIVISAVNLSTLGFQGIISLAGGDMAVSGTGTIRSVQGNGIIRLNGTFLVSNLNLSGGSQMVFQQGTTQTFTDKISFSTSSTSRVKILTSGSVANFALSDYFKICVDNIDVTNVNVTGNSIVNAGAGSTLTNSSNWLKVDCSTILFPDFSFNYACVKASTYFTDKSSGPITSRSWTFGDTGSASNTSALASPLHYYNTAGTYTATLTVTGASGSKSISKPVTLIANTLADNTIQINNGSLISTVLSTNYQWLKDEQLIANATSRSYNATGTSGIYAVLIFNETCNKRSDPFTVTAIEAGIPLVNKISAYPNPTSEVLQIESAVKVTEVIIVDAVGRSMKLTWDKVSENLYRVDVSAIPSGLYILKTSTLEKSDLQKVIIRK